MNIEFRAMKSKFFYENKIIYGMKMIFIFDTFFIILKLVMYVNVKILKKYKNYFLYIFVTGKLQVNKINTYQNTCTKIF